MAAIIIYLVISLLVSLIFIILGIRQYKAENTIIKTMFHIIPIQKFMAKPYDELMKMFHTAEAKPSIPELKDPELTFQTHKVENFPVLEISHKKKSDSVCIYVAGGGMLKYPKPSQAKELVSLAKTTGRNMLLPYFPLAPEHDLINALNMLYATYKMALEPLSGREDSIFRWFIRSGYGSLADVIHQ